MKIEAGQWYKSKTESLREILAVRQGQVVFWSNTTRNCYSHPEETFLESNTYLPHYPLPEGYRLVTDDERKSWPELNKTDSRVKFFNKTMKVSREWFNVEPHHYVLCWKSTHVEFAVPDDYEPEQKESHVIVNIDCNQVFSSHLTRDKVNQILELMK